MSNYLLQHPRLNIRADQVEYPDGTKSEYIVMEKPDFVLIIPKIGETFYLVNQYRHPLQAMSLEFPEGTIEPDEEPIVAAERELREEVGITGSQLTKLGSFYVASGLSQQACFVYISEGGQVGEQQLETSEDGMLIETHLSTEIKSLIMSGKLKDGPSLAAWSLLSSH